MARSAIQVLNAWQKRVGSPDTDVTKEDIPVSLAMTTSGSVLLKYSLSEAPRKFKTFKEALNHIETHL